MATSIRDMLLNIATKLGLTAQDSRRINPKQDAAPGEDGLSFVDMMTGSLADLLTLQFSLPIQGDSERAMRLNKIADDYVGIKFAHTVQETYRSGDSITIPFWTGRNFQNVLVDADQFIITSRFGDEITGIVYLVDEHKIKDDKYHLLQVVELQDSEIGQICRYQMILGKNGDPFPNIAPGMITPAWAEYVADWYVPGVDRLLVGRLKSPKIAKCSPNSIKGIPICSESMKPICELHYLYGQLHTEFELSEKTIFADKGMFREDQRDQRRKKRLPRGIERVIQKVAAAKNSDDRPFLEEWSPEIRFESYMEDINEQFRLFERTVGVSEGILSRVDTANYENVDNVRKSMRKTQSFIETSRRLCEQYLEDLVYSWNVLLNHYKVGTMGEYSIVFDWSDEYINTYHDKLDGLINGSTVGAVGPVDVRMFLFKESPETAREKVAEIQGQQAMGGISLMDGEGEATTGGASN